MEFRSCDKCFKFFNGITPYNDHLASKKHKKKVDQEMASAMAVDTPGFTSGTSFSTCDSSIESLGRGFYCTLCKLNLYSLDQVKSHIIGTKHLKLKMWWHPAEGEGPKVDFANIKLSNFLKESYTDLKFTFHDISIQNVLENVKVFGVNDPIMF